MLRNGGLLMDLINKTFKTFKSLIVSRFGERVIDGKCKFCNREIGKEFCSCVGSEQINKYCHKAQNFIDTLVWIVGNNDDVINNQRKSVKTPPNFTGMQFDDYKTINSSQKNALQQIKKYGIEAFENYLFGKNLFLIGNYGTGKTMLMTILARYIASETLAKVSFINAVDLVNKVKNTFNPNESKTALGVADEYKKVHFLFLDDIDKINTTEYIKELLYSVVNYRTEHELPTITSANHNLEELERLFGEATISRLANKDKTIIVQFNHQNWRVC